MSKPFTDSPTRDAGRLIVTPHPVLLDGQRTVAADLQPGESLADFLRRHVPDIDSGAWAVSIGGLDVPRLMWDRTWPKHGQFISCRASVHKSALKFVALGAVAFFSAGTALLVAGLGVGAALIAKALQPKIPSTPTAENGREIYSLRSQRNSARPYAPIGTLLGELRVTPDLASQSYTWFEGDDQYLSTILLGGINVASYSDLTVGDTPLASFSDVAVYTNGFSGMASEDVPLFSNADSTAGATLEDTTAWVTRTSAIDTVMLQLDFEYQLYHQRGEGSPQLTIVAEYRAVGASTWLALRSETYTNKTTEVRRVTWSLAVPKGQYEVRARRAQGVNEENITRSVQWAILRSVQPDGADYSGWGRIGIRIKATGQLNGSLDTVRATFKPRPLPVWNGSAWVNATTRPGVSNPGALILQVLRGIWDGDVLQFGYGLSDDQIDVEGLKGFMLHCTAMGFTYDRWITEQISLGALLDEIALAGLGQFMWLDGSRPTVMWAADDQPLGGVVNMANMSRGSFSVAYDLAEAADGIEYQYVDRSRNYETATLRVMAPGVTTMLKPARVTGQGVTSEAHAAILARYHLAQSLYQYKEISFGTDLERLDYRRMSMLSLSHDMTQWGYGGRLIGAAVVGSDVVLTLDEPVPALPSRFVGLRIPGERDYRVFGVQAFTGTSDTITLTGSWPAGVAFPGGSAANPAHDTLWCYDVKATPGYRVRVTAIEPESDLKGATVRAVPESDEFWDYVLTGSYVPAPSESLIPELDAPAVLNIRVQSQINRQGDTEWVQLNVVWDSTGDMHHAQVWAAIDGQPLRLVDSQAVGNRSSFRIDENGDWLIQVRPFDGNGKGGASASVLFAASGIDRPPANVDIFDVSEVDGSLRRYRFGYSGASPVAYAGVRIRYRAGSTPVTVSDWDSMTPLGEASDVYTQAAESTLPAAGVWTFACRAISTAGVLSTTVAQVTRTLAGTFSDIIDPDLTPAPTPTGGGVTVGFASLFLEHDAPTYTQGHGHGKTRVYGVVYTGGAEPVFSSASLLTEFTGTSGAYPTTLGTAWRVWMTWVTADGVESLTPAGAGGGNGFAAQTGLIGGANIAPLAVDAAKLAAGAVDLGGSKVTGTITDPARFGAAAIGYTVTQYLVATSGYMGNLVVDNAQIASLSVAKLLGGSLDVSAYIQSPGYSPGASGWRISADGTARFRNLIVDGNSFFDGQVTMRRPDGSIAFQSGGTLNWADITPAAGWLNSNIGIINGQLVGAGTTAAGVQIDNSFVATGQNLLPNSDQASAMTWGINPQMPSATLGYPLQWAVSIWGSPTIYTLRSASTKNVAFQQSNRIPGGNGVAVYDVYPMGWWGADYCIPVRAGQRYIWSYYAQAHRCGVGGGISWFNADGGQLGSSIIEFVYPPEGHAQALEQYTRVYVSDIAPAGAVGACPYMRKYNTRDDQPHEDSWMWMAAPQFEAVPANAQGPSPYQPGPVTTARQLGYTGDLNATLGADWSATVTNRPGNLAGLSGSESIRNDWITIDGAGKLQGIGTGAGVTVSNSAISITINANGTVGVTGGPSVGGGVTLSGLGAGAMAAINAITEANASTYLSGAIIDLANIKLASINTLAALSSYLGAVEIATGGHLRSGKSSFADTTAGFWLANVGGVPQFHVGNAAAYLRYSTASGLEIKLDTFTASASPANLTAYPSDSAFGFGSSTVSVSGGVGPYTYVWRVDAEESEPAYHGTRASISPSGNSCSMDCGFMPDNSGYSGLVSCVVTDANGRSATAFVALYATRGTIP